MLLPSEEGLPESGWQNKVICVKIKHGIFGVIVIVLVTAMFSAGCKTPSPANVEGPKSAIGFNGPLKLVAEYKPLHLYIYADVTSTNKHPDYIIFQRNEPLVIADNVYNTVEMIFCEKRFRGQFTTTYDYKEQILTRSFSTYGNNSMQTNYLYFDTNGDGEWDFLHTFGASNEISMSFVRSNLC